MANYLKGAARRLSRGMTEEARVAAMPRVQELRKVAGDLFIRGPSGERMIYLRCRWLDEREHEDWSDYVAEFKKLVPAGFEFERACKNPFGFTMTAKGMPGAVHVTATVNSISLKHIRI